MSSLADEYPDVAIEAFGWDPSSVSAGSGRIMEWKCARAHVYPSAIYSRTAGSGCPYCAGRKILKGFNDLESQYPEIASEADGWDPSMVLGGTHAKKDWLCPLGHPHKSSVVKRTASKRGCPKCSGKEVLIGFNDLATKRPDIAAEANDWDPTTVTVRSGLTRNWICSNQHVYDMRVADRTDPTKPQNCPYCSGKRVLAGFNDLLTKFPEVAKEADGWDPSEFNYASNKLKPWICRLGHRWPSSINNRTNRNSLSGCPYCDNKKVLVGFNDLQTKNPSLAVQADGWDPTTVTPNSGKKMRWKCPLGHGWTTSVDHRSNGQGCPSCTKFGYDPNEDGYLYLIFHPRWDVYKIGISNSPLDRTNKHKSNGWELSGMRGPMDGLLAYSWEQSILKMLQKRGVEIGVTDIAGKFDGYTESWAAKSFHIEFLSELMDLVRDDEL